MFDQALAIIRAQYLSIRNFYSGGHRGRALFAVFLTSVWYGIWVLAAIAVSAVAADPTEINFMRRTLPSALLLIFLYWQFVPIFLVSSGMSLDLRRLIVYPIPRTQLFGLEVILRLTTCPEMILILAGLWIGLWRNPAVPFWAPLGLALFLAFNLLLSAGMRDLLGRLLSRKRVREVLIFVLVLLAALPRILFTAEERRIRAFLTSNFHLYWPWSATANFVLGITAWMPLVTLILWTAAAYAFGQWQFRRSLRFDAEEARASETGQLTRRSWLERLYRIPSRIFPDPLGALVEKEIRFLSRSSRFRLVFLMGFSFGLIVWLPFAFERGNRDGAMAQNYLTIVSVYALMLLGDVCFWNSLGFDRKAVQVYYVMPVPISSVLLAKNISATFFVFLEITMVAIVCALLRLPLTASMIAESFSVAFVLTVFLLAIGNLMSVRSPRPIDPAQSWRRSSAGRVQAFLLVVYPAAAAPVMLAYAARYAFDSQIAFYATLLFDLAIGGIFYWIAMESSVNASHRLKEEIVTLLSQGEGPVTG